MIRDTNEIPWELFDLDISELAERLREPSLFHIKGARTPPLFVSTLLHGNEHTGFLAMQKWLKPYYENNRPIPRDLILFIGNVEAARENQRKLSHQPDYNRIWDGYGGPEGDWAREVVSLAKKENVFAAIDIHNNSGRNPYYACVSKWETDHIRLASLFGRIVVYADQPVETLTHAFSRFTPAVTLEVGLSGLPAGVAHTASFLDACWHLSGFPSHSIAAGDINGYQTLGRIVIPPETNFAFEGEINSQDVDLLLRGDLDLLNFSELPAGTPLGRVQSRILPLTLSLVVEDQARNPLSLLHLQGDSIVTTRTLIPAMLTLNHRNIRQDCLGYLMEPKKL